ncbi:MAG: hypothetical protein HY290_11640 [Planctomycetia bacterium]|nr:hypothetical protein [Planctomycetia bacterium]
MARNRPQRASRLSLALMTALWCAAVRGDTLTPEVRDARRKEIAAKSGSERARLQQNFKDFRDENKFSEAQRDWLRQFARALKEDDRGEGKLRSVMNDYFDWLSTLTPGQRDDLRKESDPAKREKRVRDLLKKQQELADATGDKAGTKAPGPQGFRKEDLDGVLNVVEQAIRKYTTPEENEQLKKKRGVSRHSFILDLAFRPRPGFGPQALPQWWSKEALELMIEAVSHPGQKHRLRNIADKPQQARFMILNMLVQGIRTEYEAEYEKIKPDQAALERFFVQLNSEGQDEIMRLPFDQQQKKLFDAYMAKKSAEDPDNFPHPPQFLWLQRMQQAAAQRLNRPGDPPRPADADTSQREINKKKKDKPKGKAGKAGAEPE